MAKGSEIILSANNGPKGHFEEGVIGTGVTPKPGTVMEMVRGTAADGTGRFTWKPAGTDAAVGVQGMSADGDRMAIAVLDIDHLQGKTKDDAYAAGDRCFLYFPVMGEELNMILENQSGTADDFVPGDKLIVDDGTGKLLISASTPESEPFLCLETVTDMAADTLTWVRFTGY